MRPLCHKIGCSGLPAALQLSSVIMGNYVSGNPYCSLSVALSGANTTDTFDERIQLAHIYGFCQTECLGLGGQICSSPYRYICWLHSLPLFTWFVLIFYIFNSLALFYCTILSHDVITPIFLRGNTSFDFLFNRNLIGKSVVPGRNMWSALHVAFLW